MRSCFAPICIFCIRHPEGVKRPRQSVSPALSISGKSADLPGYLLCFLLFQGLRFLPLWEESSKEAHEGGERKISPPCDPPLCAPEWSSFDDPPPRRTPICLAPIEMFPAGNLDSVSDEEPRYAFPTVIHTSCRMRNKPHFQFSI